MHKPDLAVFWFRRDLRLTDNTGLYHALKSGLPVLPIFIFDDAILEELPKDDGRVQFIHETISNIDIELKKLGSSLLVKKGTVQTVWRSLVEDYAIKEVFFNKDYEPYAVRRDEQIKKVLTEKGIVAHTFKDDVIFEESEVLKDDGTPYTVFTPFKNRWLRTFEETNFQSIAYKRELLKHCYQLQFQMPSLAAIGFIKSKYRVKSYNLDAIDTYEKHRDFPAIDKTSYLSPHLRFGAVSVRKLVSIAMQRNATFLSELIWREFFKVILFHFPKVVTQNFKPAYDGVPWRDAPEDFERWCNGETGYPMVDAGMRQLNGTGYMHNRVRMITAGFLCKHLLIDWRFGEAYFAKKLLDYDLSANNGNWQWAAGTGCDSAPYFRIFNPISQQQKFDKESIYIRKWIKDYDELNYPKPMVDHKFARERALATYKTGIIK